jgi:hypothetical protein
MNSFFSIPREALAELLRAAGSPLTPEQYVASLPQAGISEKYRSRAVAAAISKYCLLVVAVVGVATLPMLGLTVENIIIVIGLITVTYFEYRVHLYFREGDPRGPDLGFRNQSLFAAAIVLYCFYHALAPFNLSHDEMTMVEESNVIDPKTLHRLFQMFYFGIAVLAGGSQFSLAWYYRSAKA